MKKKQAGISLIIVLWMLAIMTVIALAFSHSVRTEVMLTSNFQNQAKSMGLAEAGIWRGVAMVLNKSIAKSSGQDIRLDGSTYSLETDEGELKILLQSSSGLVDINRASAEVIQALLVQQGAAEEQVKIITDSLLDWRDKDDLKHLFGAETADYMAQGLSYGAKNGLINSIEEMGRINGMTQSLYLKILPLITVYSGQARVDVNTVPRSVLHSLPGMSDSIVDSILADRESGTGQINLTTIPAETRRYIGAGKNTFVQISSRAVINNSISGMMAIIQLEADRELPVKIMSWRQGLDSRFKK
jgi:general secretion pathway protein K